MHVNIRELNSMHITLATLKIKKNIQKAILQINHTYHWYSYSRPTGQSWVLAVTQVSLQLEDCRTDTQQTAVG